MTDTMNPRLDDLKIASPCSADWNAMQGDDRSRFCAQCSLHVHDLSAMTADAAEAFLRDAAGDRTCVRLFRRADGTVLTRDCPVGLRKRLRRAAARAAALWLALWGSLFATASCSTGAGEEPTGGESAPVPPPLMGTPALMGEAVMGDVADPQIQAAPPPVPRELLGRVRSEAPPRK